MVGDILDESVAQEGRNKLFWVGDLKFFTKQRVCPLARGRRARGHMAGVGEDVLSYSL